MAALVCGGCQCGRIRYTVAIDNHEAYLCHCRMCQRATGGVSVAFKGVRLEDLTWVQEPDWYQSSPIARRSFCSTCGTPLGFEYLGSDEIDKCDLTVGSFDEPGGFHPVTQFGMESRHEAWSNTADLPGTRCDEYGALMKKWSDAGAPMPL
jgi:hypothetical protein